MEYKKELRETLTQLGMGEAFSSKANFSRMLAGTTSGLAISEVMHKTFLEVNKEGTEAAAAYFCGRGFYVAAAVRSSGPPLCIPYPRNVLECYFVYWSADEPLKKLMTKVANGLFRGHDRDGAVAVGFVMDQDGAIVFIFRQGHPLRSRWSWRSLARLVDFKIIGRKCRCFGAAVGARDFSGSAILVKYGFIVAAIFFKILPVAGAVNPFIIRKIQNSQTFKSYGAIGVILGGGQGIFTVN